jgi:hypothetical protein
MVQPKTTPEKKADVQAKPEYVAQQGYFDFVVLTYEGLLPGQKGYEEKKDQLRTGFQFGGNGVPNWMPKEIKSVKDISAYDFLTNPKTGLRQGQKDPPSGAISHSLERGLNSWHDIPPLWIWNKGEWLCDLYEEEKNFFDPKDLPIHFQTKIKEAYAKAHGSGIPSELYPYWVTSGEGTAGNYLYRVYLLPNEIAGETRAKHPMLWKKALKTPKSLFEDTYTKKSSTTPNVSLPFGVRIRCTGCGHWFKENDLPGHAQVCGKGEEVDWAMMCCDECGCRTLDQASTPKPGFPRAKKEEPKKEEPSATKKAADKREGKDAVQGTT